MLQKDEEKGAVSFVGLLDNKGNSTGTKVINELPRGRAIEVSSGKTFLDL
ncbi:MAG: hypothetical protein L3J09_07425 [Flavobacteriaceae bacterium]|nr:hypothetical protein [Flavobacteriaceae bacterium]